MAELSEPDLDDDDEESVMEPMNRFQEHQPQFYQNSTPFSTQSQENVILHGSNEGSRSNEQLEILYNARGMEIQRLKEENLNLTSQFSAEIRQLKHENTLLKGQSGKNQINFEHYQNLASVQSEENQTLRREIDDLKAKLIRSEAQKSEIQSDNDSKKLMIESLQIQLGELQKSDTILRAKKQHEETLRSLKERHENQIFQLEQEIDRLNSQVRKFDQEMDLAHGKLRKNQLEYDKILMEKSDTIKDLQDRLDASQKRFANFMMENSSYSNLKLINEKFQSDKENFAREICNFQMEIEHLKSEIQTKNEQIQLKDKEKTRLKNDFENLLADKSSTIELLTHKLNDSEQKINRLMRESLTGSTNFAKEELERLKNELMDRDVQILKLKADLEEAQIKYSTFKKRVKLVQTQWKNKEERLKENLKTSEEDFKAKLLSLRDKMQEVYDTKLNEVRLSHELHIFFIPKAIIRK